MVTVFEKLSLHVSYIGFGSVRYRGVKRVYVSLFAQWIGVTNLQCYTIILQGSQVQVPSPSECVYPRSPALGLGLTASVALMVAQIIINVASGCVCCRKGQHQSASNWMLALICFVVSW